MARQKLRYLKEGATPREVVIPNPKTGVNSTFVVLPFEDLVEDFSAAVARKKISLRDRFFGFFRKEAAERTSFADDEKTTQMGTMAFGDLGITRGFQERTKLEHVRRSKYTDFERMDTESTIGNRALTITVSNAFMSEDGDHDSYEVDSKNNRVLTIIKDLDHRTNLKEESPGMMRIGLKFGDDFEELCWDVSKRLINRIAWLNPMHIERNEDRYGRIDALKAFVQKDTMGEEVAAFNFYQVVHTRYNHERGNKYGTSFFDPARRPNKIRHVMEEGVAINRISRSIDRLAFYIPVPKGAQDYEQNRIVNAAMTKFRKRVAVDSSGNVDMTRASFSDVEDIFIGMEGKDSSAKVEVLKGSTIIGQLGDVEYFQNLEIMGYNVPKAYLQIERDLNSKATLGHEDIEFARMLRFHQKKFSWFLRVVYDRQLTALGVEPAADLYTITWPTISFIDQRMRAEVNMLKWQIAAIAKQTFGIPTPWLLREVIGLDDDAINEIEADIVEPAMQMPGAAPAGVEIGKRDRESVRDRFFNDRRLAAEVHALRDIMTTIAAEGLNRPMAA